MFLQEYSNIFSEKGAKRQSLLGNIKYKIKLLREMKPPHSPIYPLSAEYLETLWKYIIENIKKRLDYTIYQPRGIPRIIRTKGQRDLIIIYKL